MENSVCLDTDILIDFIRNNKETVDWVKQHEENYELATTTVNVFELFYGVYESGFPKANMKDVEDLISRLKILNLSLESTREGGKQLARLKKEGNIVEFRDILIGSIALTERFMLKTNNKKHFLRIEGLKVI